MLSPVLPSFSTEQVMGKKQRNRGSKKDANRRSKGGKGVGGTRKEHGKA